MGAKLSKAKRPKRRWIGIDFPEAIKTRDDLKKSFTPSSLSACNIRIYDFHDAETDVAVSVCKTHRLTNKLGIAIVCVLLLDYGGVREYFDSEVNEDFVSLSSSSL